MKPESGYAHVAKYGRDVYLGRIPAEDWEIEVVTPTGTEEYVGCTYIDGTRHNVWWSKEGCFWAQVRR